MRHRKGATFAVLAGFILLFLSALDAQEEANGDANVTIYNLGETEALVEESVNGSSFDLTLFTKASNITLRDINGDEVDINCSVTFWRGAYIHEIVADKEIAGNLSYTLPAQKQHFVASLSRKGEIWVILPPDYSTGDAVLGLPRPKPDEIVTDDDRMVLIWKSPYPEHNVIEINYYGKDAPHALRMLMLFFLVAGALVMIEHLLSMKQLRLFQKNLEEELQHR